MLCAHRALTKAVEIIEGITDDRNARRTNKGQPLLENSTAWAVGEDGKVSCNTTSQAVCRVCQNHTYICIYCVYMVFFTGTLLCTRSYTVYMYGSGQP